MLEDADRRYGADSDDSPLRDDPPRPGNYRGYVVRLTSKAPAHPPVQPTWHCATCGEEWPCEPARKQLLAEAESPAALGILMWNHLEEYLRDEAGRLNGSFARFLGWTWSGAER